MRSPLLRTLRVVVLLTLLGGSLAGAGRAAARGPDGDVFADEDHGWSVAFDDGFWDAEEIDEPDVAGVRLTGDGAVGNLRVFDDGVTDTGDCVAGLARRSMEGGELEGLEPADRTELDPPDTATNAESALYAGALAHGDGRVEVALYLECREVLGGTLAVDVTIPVEGYDAVVPDVEALLHGIVTPDPFGSPNADDEATATATPDDAPPDATDEAEDATPTAEDATPTAEDDEAGTPTVDDEEPVAHDDDDRLGGGRAASLDDDSYASRLGYAVTVDPDVFEITADDGSRGVDLAARDAELTVSLLAFDDPSIDDCVDREVAAVRANPDNASVSESRARAPRSADGASGRVLRVVEDTARQGRLIVYVECRPLADEGEGGDPTFVVVRATSGAASFGTTRPLIEDLLAGISLGDGSTGDGETSAGGASSADDRVDGETDLAAGVFVGDVVPFRLAWDPGYWTGAETEIGVTLTAVDGASFLSVEQYSVGPGAGFTEAGCVLEPVDAFAATLPDIAESAPPGGQAIAWPERVGNTLAAGTLVLADGSAVTQIVGVGCLELEPGQRYLRFIFSTVDVVYPASVAELNDVLTSLVVDEDDRAALLHG